MTPRQLEFPFETHPPPRPRAPTVTIKIPKVGSSLCGYCGWRMPEWAIGITPPSDDVNRWAKVAEVHKPGCYWVKTFGLRQSEGGR
jgi:hypothetical protein